MSVITISGGTSSDTGSLSADTLFAIEEGRVMLSSDAGTTKVGFSAGEKVIFSAGLTVHYYNEQPIAARMKTTAI